MNTYPFTQAAYDELTRGTCTKTTAELARDYRIAKINLARDPSERNRAILAMVEEEIAERFGVLVEQGK